MTGARGIAQKARVILSPLVRVLDSRIWTNVPTRDAGNSTFDAFKIPSMHQRIAHIALVVKDYDEAIQFYTEKIGFTLLEDTKLSEEKRWVLVAPPGAKECCLLLAKAANDHQLASVGNQTGGRVFFFLFTDDFWRD